MTSPKHAHATDRGRYYTRPGTGEQLISVTNVLSEAVSKPALVPWAAKMTAEAAWDSLPRMIAAMRRPCDCRPTSSADERGAADRKGVGAGDRVEPDSALLAEGGGM